MRDSDNDVLRIVTDSLRGYLLIVGGDVTEIARRMLSALADNYMLIKIPEGDDITVSTLSGVDTRRARFGDLIATVVGSGSCSHWWIDNQVTGNTIFDDDDPGDGVDYVAAIHWVKEAAAQ